MASREDQAPEIDPSRERQAELGKTKSEGRIQRKQPNIRTILPNQRRPSLAARQESRKARGSAGQKTLTNRGQVVDQMSAAPEGMDNAGIESVGNIAEYAPEDSLDSLPVIRSDTGVALDPSPEPLTQTPPATTSPETDLNTEPAQSQSVTSHYETEQLTESDTSPEKGETAGDKQALSSAVSSQPYQPEESSGESSNDERAAQEHPLVPGEEKDHEPLKENRIDQVALENQPSPVNDENDVQSRSGYQVEYRRKRNYAKKSKRYRHSDESIHTSKERGSTQESAASSRRDRSSRRRHRREQRQSSEKTSQASAKPTIIPWQSSAFVDIDKKKFYVDLFGPSPHDLPSHIGTDGYMYGCYTVELKVMFKTDKLLRSAPNTLPPLQRTQGSQTGSGRSRSRTRRRPAYDPDAVNQRAQYPPFRFGPAAPNFR